MWRMPNLRKRYLTEIEYRQVEVLFAGIFPGDPKTGVPSATDAGAADFLTRLLALGPAQFRDIPTWRNQYTNVLPLLDQVARKRWKTPLAELTGKQCECLMIGLKAGELTEISSSLPAKEQKDFFKMLRLHCLQGCFADPRWGGNRNGVMWKWIGWPGFDDAASRNDTDECVADGGGLPTIEAAE